MTSRQVLQEINTKCGRFATVLIARSDQTAHRHDVSFAQFAAQGISLTDQDMQRIHSPIGLDIGAEAPDEIALSIVSEIQSKFSNRSGGFLKYHPGPIHQRDPDSDQVFKQVYLDNPSLKNSVSNI